MTKLKLGPIADDKSVKVIMVTMVIKLTKVV